MRVFITGGGHGIGRATAERLVTNGHDVTVFDIKQEYLDTLPDEIEAVQGDVYDTERVKDVLEDEEIDVVINCAGYQALGAIEDMSLEEMERHFETNVFGLVGVTKAALPSIRANEGRIINISSLAVRVIGPFWGAYAASKHAVEAFSDALRIELLQEPVDVVVIEPGAIKTGFNENGAKNLERYLPTSSYAEEYRNKIEDGFEGMSPEKASKKVVKAVEAKNPSPRYTITREAWLLPKLKALIPTRLWDRLAWQHETN